METEAGNNLYLHAYDAEGDQIKSLVCIPRNAGIVERTIKYAYVWFLKLKYPELRR